MTPNLLTATHALYAEFKAPAPRHIEACPCCLDQDEIDALINTPLKELNADQLSSYMGSLFHTVGNVIDYKYFLPRIFELNIEDPPWMVGTEIVMDKLRLAEWQSWPNSEKDAVQLFIDVWFQVIIENADEPEDGIYYYHPVDQIICGIAHAGLPLVKYLERLIDFPVALKTLYFCNEDSLNKSQRLTNGFWEEFEQAEMTVKVFLSSDQALDVLTR